MSTKATIAHGEEFHFYHEVGDQNHVYLRLRTMAFEAGYGRVVIPIPIHIWETIRHLGGARLDLVNHTDEELLKIVEAEVDERIAEYRQALREDPKSASLISLFGSIPYGGAEEPREEQVASGTEYYRREREHQREIQAAIMELRQSQHRETEVLLNLDERQVAADLLIVLIEHLSREFFATDWSRELESQLWEAAKGQSDKFKRQSEQARYLSDKSQGWAVWDEAADRPKHIPLSQWEAIYCKRITKKIEKMLGGGNSSLER